MLLNITLNSNVKDMFKNQQLNIIFKVQKMLVKKLLFLIWMNV